ncbi:Transposase IS4 [Popillia japonica]|uniref:Transposase IS4 n=1 Tax=Popillia japonica TaxID=7064 RepID=A0AAW1LYT9_POPJA
MPKNTPKRDFKVWALACSNSGYLLKFFVYEGKSNTDEIGTLGERVVKEISNTYQDKGYCLFFDNYFSTVPLIQELLERKFFTCARFRSDRKYSPADLLKDVKKMKFGDSKYAMAGDVSFTVWKDRGTKPVMIVSTMHNPSSTTTVKTGPNQQNKLGQKEDICRMSDCRSRLE